MVCGDAGPDLGDSIYEAIIYVQGKVASLGADCIEKEMTREHADTLRELLRKSGIEADPKNFRRYGSARKLYHFHVDHADDYLIAMKERTMSVDRRTLRSSATFPEHVLAEIHRAADEGVYDIRGIWRQAGVADF